MMTKILYVCTVPALESYSAGIISAAFLSDKLDVHACICLEGNDQRSKANLLTQFGVPEGKENQVIFVYLAANKLVRVLSASKYLLKAAAFARKNEIKKVHFISQDIMLAGHLSNFQQFQVFYTVHDLVPHDVRLNLFRRIKHYYFRIRKDKMLIKQVPNLVTNNLKQLGQLKRLYRGKRIVFHQMPGLVTPGIKAGVKKIGELGATTDYILFFGRIEFYKGIEHLYNLFINNSQLSDQVLVIAGSGNIYFKRYPQREKNVIFINRYVEEQEMNDLFSKARFMVLPYLSATQSAVTSLAYHYHLPVVGSDIDGIKDTILHEKTGLIYDPGDQDALNNSILTLLNNEVLSRQIQTNLQNVYLYDQNELKNQINGIYLD